MRKVLATRNLTATGEATVLAFETSSYLVYLTIAGQKSFEVSGRCDTCPYAFTKLVDAPTIDFGGVVGRLSETVDDVPDDVTTLLSRGLPAGDYVATLLEVEPASVSLGEADDYFATEQLGIWQGSGALAIEGGRHDPRTSYYRTATSRHGTDAMFYEFIVPLQSSLSRTRFEHWREQLAAGIRPAALAVGLGERRQPAVWEGEPEITTHLCVSHYLLDGHHRVAAAARDRVPIRLLTAYALSAASPPPWPPADAVTQSFLTVAL